MASSGHLSCRMPLRPYAGIVGVDPVVTTSYGFGHRLYTFDTSAVVPLRSSSCRSPDPVNPSLFLPRSRPWLLAKAAEGGFGACSCKPTPRGRPSSVKQLRTSSAFRLFAVLVAHYCRLTGNLNMLVLRTSPLFR